MCKRYSTLGIELYEMLIGLIKYMINFIKYKIYIDI